MKKIHVAWTFLDTIEVPDDATFEEIEEFLDDYDPYEGDLNDREWSYANED